MNFSVMDFCGKMDLYSITCVNFKKWPINQLSKQKMDIFLIDFLSNKWIFCSLCRKTLTPS